MSTLISPFADQSRLAAWEASNCDRCSRGWSARDGFRCPIQLALRCSVPGPIAGEVAARMGFATPIGLRPRDGVWPCREAARHGLLAPIVRRQPEESIP